MNKLVSLPILGRKRRELNEMRPGSSRNFLIPPRGLDKAIAGKEPCDAV